MVLGGPIYTAMDGPGGPILGGTTYSMTGVPKDEARGSCFIVSSPGQRSKVLSDWPRGHAENNSK